MIAVTLWLIWGWFNHSPCNLYWFRNILSIIFIVWCLIVLFLLGSLFVLHVYLVIVSKTTSEFLRAKRKQKDKSTATKTQTENGCCLLNSNNNNNKCNELVHYCISSASDNVSLLMKYQISDLTGNHAFRLSGDHLCRHQRSHSTVIVKEKEKEDISGEDDRKTKQYNPYSTFNWNSRLLPLWQYENDEDTAQQRELINYIFERFKDEIFPVETTESASAFNTRNRSFSSTPGDFNATHTQVED
jgi:hypothetical protein